MKNILVLFLSIFLITACTDYDSQFDQIDNKLKELAAANDSLEAEIAAMAALNASVSAQTNAELEEFQGAVAGIVGLLTQLGEVSQGTYLKVLALIDAISDLGELVAANAISGAELAARIAAIQAMIDEINTNVLHHSGGGSTDDDGSTSDDDGSTSDDDGSTSDDHHSGGGSTDDGGSTSDDHHSGGGSTDDGGSTSTATDNGDGALDLIVTVPAGTTALRLSGPWWGWDPSGGPVGVDNGDGTFTFTLDPAPTENMEYLYTVDGANYENLIDNAAGGECTSRVDGGLINTDYANYANRIWIVGSGDQAETYDSCSIDTVD